MQHTKSDQAHARTGRRRRRIFTGAVAVVSSAGLAAAVLLPSGTALAAYQQPPPGTTATPSSVATVTVTEAILLSGLPATIPLSGAPGDTPTATVTYNVYTNDPTGYSVTVQAVDADFSNAAGLVPAFPVSDLDVADSTAAATVDLTPAALSATTAVPVYSQTTASADLGDTLSTTYTVPAGVPNVPFDTYTDTIDYTAATNI